MTNEPMEISGEIAWQVWLGLHRSSTRVTSYLYALLHQVWWPVTVQYNSHVPSYVRAPVFDRIIVLYRPDGQFRSSPDSSRRMQV